MKLSIILTLALLSSLSIFSQVGIGTTNPDATLHIKGTTVIGGSGTSTLISDSFEDNTLSPFTSSGDELWELTTNASEVNSGTLSARTIDALDDNESSTLQYTTTITTTGTISFAVTTSTESCCDELTFYIDGVSQQVFAGTTSYTTVSFPLSTGAHTLTWTYEKDSSLSSGDDRVAIDDVLITETTTGGTNSYTFRLEDGQQQAGYVLTSDADGYATWLAPSGGGGSGTDDQAIDVFSLSGNILSLSIEDDGVATQTVDLSSLSGGGTYSFENGISESGNTVRLGGDLTQTTYINLLNRDLYFESTGGDITIENATGQSLMTTRATDEFVGFGRGFASVDSDEGDSFSDSGNNPYTKKFILGYHNSESGGSGFQMGSIEYVVDGTNELFLQASAFSPMTNLGCDLGAGSTFQSGPVRNWDDVYADDFVATSGNIYNKNSDNNKGLEKGLEKILKLKPISYKEQSLNIGNRMSTEAERDIKLGFYASELVNVIPEAVKTSDWITIKEGEDKVKTNITNPTGIMYNQIIPVTVKAIQEQQEQIELLKEAVVELKKQNDILKTLIESKK